ncbi:TonB-dependent receptor [Prevotella sp. KH2C16]|uniref:TonB-dependent receptor n=1 Tax=Prevotella sp. KH2C16 TaxID=1855325 RepID=UPI0008F080AB|nr:TonB-dependent receptor [Prevotella sp. KH2C16]SFF84397.1 TonB-linked outer membrane protein, SusC/RagA family [Prevotella sp. KH2C16]
MNLKKIILLAIAFSYGMVSLAQGLNLNLKNVSVKKAMTELYQKTGYSFVYEAADLNTSREVSVHATSLEKAIEQILAGQDVDYKIQGKNIIVSHRVSRTASAPDAKRHTVTGSITDSKGEPIIGASVKVRGTNLGTVTDIDGNFSMDVPEGSDLEISYVGFRTQTIKSPGKQVSVNLIEDTEALDEVVVIGYGTKRKANLIGAVSTVTANEIKDRPVSSVGQMLQGQVPNLNITFGSGTPGESTILNIRGATSIVNSGAPLVLIDGVEGDIDRVNPNDIESISVLKDAASAAIYGARAGFGVILITTKSNKDGNVHITYNGRYSFSAPTTKTDFMTNGYDVARLVDEFNMATNNSSYTNFSQADYAELEARRYDTVEDSNRPWITIGSDGRYHYYGNFNWYDYLLDYKQPTWSNNLNINGGNEKFNYIVSGSANDRKGIYAISTDKYHTRTLMTKFNVQVTSWLDISSSASLFKSNYKQPGYDYEDGGNFGNLSFHAMPWLSPINPDGTNVYTQPNSGNYPGDGFYAMIRTGNGFTKVQKTQQTYALGATIHILPGLDLIGKYTYKNYIKDKQFRVANFEYSERPGQILTANSGFFANRLKEIRQSESVSDYDLYATYSKVFNNAHNLNIVLGTNYEIEHYKNVEASSYTLQSEILNDLALATGNKGAKGGQHEFALLGYFGRISYDYLGKYLAEVNMRYDGTSRFPSGNRWGFFPSIALGWRVSDEKFFNPIKSVVSNFKLRGSIGSLGNQVTDGYPNAYYPYIRRAAITNTTTIGYIFDNAQAAYIKLDAPVSGSLTWETIVTKNFGMDLGFFDNKLNVNIDIYRRDTKDMLASSLTLPNVYGYNAPLENNGQLKTNGYEIMLNWNDHFNLIGHPFIYSISASLADNKSKLVKYAGNETKTLGKNYEGMEWGEIWGYHIEGIYKTDADAIARGVDQTFLGGNRYTSNAGDLIFSDIDNSKKIDNGKGTLEDHGDLIKIGNSQPRYHYSFSLNMSWYGFDFSMFWQGIGKQNIYPGQNNMMFWGPYARAYSSFIPADFAGKVWSTDNLDSYFPRAGTDQARWFAMSRTNDRYLQNLAYCRLKNLTIGYTLPKILTKKINLDQIRFYFSGENLLTTTKLKSDYLDPEQMTTDSNGRVYPFSKTFSFGVDISF